METCPSDHTDKGGLVTKGKCYSCVIDWYGTYINHISTLAQNDSLRSNDRARLKGYAKKWANYRILVGCAVYVDILKGPALLNLSLQGYQLDTVLGIKSIMKTSSALRSLAKLDPLQWPTVKIVLSRIIDEEGKRSYQGDVLKNFNQSVVEMLKRDAKSDLTALDDKTREHLQWSNTDLLHYNLC